MNRMQPLWVVHLRVTTRRSMEKIWPCSSHSLRSILPRQFCSVLVRWVRGCVVYAGPGIIPSTDLLSASGSTFDAFSFHLYPAVSNRCSKMGASMGTTAADALSAEWLARPQTIEAYSAGLRDKFDPKKPLWITETADTACGGNPWASTFLDTFRYLNQLGMMAHDGVRVVMHNTLDSSDYGLLHKGDFTPRPNFWAAVLWRRLMGTQCCRPGVSITKPAPLRSLSPRCEGRRGYTRHQRRPKGSTNAHRA